MIKETLLTGGLSNFFFPFPMSNTTSLQPQNPPPPPIQKETMAGNYFVSNYPPFSFWKPEFVPEFLAALGRPPARLTPDTPHLTPLGLYVHIPFCRKRCHF